MFQEHIFKKTKQDKTSFTRSLRSISVDSICNYFDNPDKVLF